MKILITGATGFIGRYLSDYLLGERYDVYGTCFEPENYKTTHSLDQVKLIRCDVRKRRPVERLIGRVRPERIYHLAAQSYPLVSWKKPILTINTNVIGTINVFEAVKKLKLNCRVLVACSSAEYGYVPESDVPVKENYPLKPLHPYGISKVAQDLLAYQYFRNYNIETIRARIFNTTGPGKIKDVCSDFTRRVVEIEKDKSPPRLRTGNLEPCRDITDVRDMVRALSLLLEKGVTGEAYNCCSGQVYQIAELVDKIIERSIKSDIEIVRDPELFRSSDEPIISGDNSKLRLQTGWSPRIQIEKTLEDMLSYWRRIL